MKKLSKAVLAAATLAGMLAIPSQVNAGADSSSGDILGIVGSDTTYYVMNLLADAHNLSTRYNPNGDKAVNIPPLASANANIETGESCSTATNTDCGPTAWLKAARLAWPGGAVLPADPDCNIQYVFGGAGSVDTNQNGKIAAADDVEFTSVSTVPGGPAGGTYEVRLGVQPPNGSGDGQKAITASAAVKGVTYAAGCLDIGRSSSAPSSSNGCTSISVCESWAFALDAIGWTYFQGNLSPAVSNGLLASDTAKIYQCATATLDSNSDGDLYDAGDTKSGYPKVRYWSQLITNSDVDVTEPAKIAAYRIQAGSGTGKDVASIFFGGRSDGIDSAVLADCDGYPSKTANDKDGDTTNAFTFPIVQEHDCRNVSEVDKPNAICFYGYSRWVLQARSLETDKRNGAIFGRFGPTASDLKRPSFSTINESATRYKGTRYVYNVIPLGSGGIDIARTSDARRFIGVSLQPAGCSDGVEGSADDCNFDGDKTDTVVGGTMTVGGVPGFVCGDTTARRIIASFGFKPITAGVTDSNSSYGTSNCRRNQAALSNS